MLINSMDMAHFVARGFLRLDAVVPREINQAFLAALNLLEADRQALPPLAVRRPDRALLLPPCVCARN